MKINKMFKIVLLFTVVIFSLSACKNNGPEKILPSETTIFPKVPPLRAKVISMPDFVKNIAGFPVVANVYDYLVQYYTPADNARVYTARFKGKYFNLVCEIGNTYKGLS